MTVSMAFIALNIDWASSSAAARDHYHNSQYFNDIKLKKK